MKFAYVCLIICLLASLVNMTIATIDDNDHLGQIQKRSEVEEEEGGEEGGEEGENPKPVVGQTVADVKAAVSMGKSLIGKMGTRERHFENGVMICYRKDKAARNAKARQEKTYNNCRFQKTQKKAWGFYRRTWYCLLKQNACKTLGKALD
ncbi:uncharacterized protein LOC141911877 [Tubulanus polymorphus]|uniref:uncharacterized protein LOC141911877 n=1 Tax=Tubulanus polymorphus TaxID=672921 RepID=UPI003DA3E44C